MDNNNKTVEWTPNIIEERKTVALEAIAKSLCILAENNEAFMLRTLKEQCQKESVKYEAGRGRDNPKEGIGSKGQDDRAKPKPVADGAIPMRSNCPYPMHRFGYDLGNQCTICAYMCPNFEVCGIPHNTRKGDSRRPSNVSRPTDCES